MSDAVGNFLIAASCVAAVFSVAVSVEAAKRRDTATCVAFLLGAMVLVFVALQELRA